ncbi:hypothetical protein ACFQJD_07035 [Haloplanus sp. GCM10025708]|uniref:hypothetical protein n=1 Tax=Haloferacaceae TaxID=1644056 RepID=UPI00360FFECA
MFVALRSRARTVLYERVYPALLGSDRDAVRSHLRTAAALAGVVAAATALSRALTVVVSPVVWDAFFGLAAVSLVGLTAANAYWRGGLLVGYAIVFAPTAAGLFVAYVGRGPFGTPGRTLGFGLLLVAAVAAVVGTPGFVVGRAARWIRVRRRARREGAT